MDEDPNVYILSVDSLQYTRFSDTLTQIADQIGAVEFTNAVAIAPQTASAMPGLAAGVYRNAIQTQGLPESGSPKPLAEVLAENGYDCGLWTDNYLFGAEYNYHRGFSAGDLGQPSRKKQVANAVRGGMFTPLFKILEWGYFNIYQRITSAASGTGNFYEPAESLHRKALRWLNNSTGQQMCWIHYMDTHHPYQPPRKYLTDRAFNTPRSRSELGQFTRKSIKSNGEAVTAEDIEDIVTAYSACCEYIGDELKSFVKRLQDHGHFIPERDVLVITADHGECLDLERYGMLGHLPAAHWEEIIHVPLLVSRPDWPRRTVDHQVSLIDVMPTILKALDLSIPESVSGRGASTPEEMFREYAYSLAEPYNPDGPTRRYRSVRNEKGWKLFEANRNNRHETILTRYDPASTTSEQIIHTTTERCPPGNPEDVKQWQRLKDKISQFCPPGEVSERSNDRTEALERHLRNLGYID